MDELLKNIDARLEQLDADYKNIINAINRIDRDRNELVSQSISVRAAYDELQRLKAEIASKEQGSDAPAQEVVEKDEPGE